MSGLKQFFFIVSLSCTILLFSSMQSAVYAGGTEYVVVRVYEPVGAKGEIVLTYGGEKSERISIEQLNSDHHEVNGNKIKDVFNRLSDQGYELVSSGSAGSGNPLTLVHVSTYVFAKDKP